MTDTSAPHTTVDTSAGGYDTDSDLTAWTGWVVFASFIMIMLGFFQAIEGLVAIFNNGFYAVGRRGLVVNVDYTVWGWVHLILGVLVLVAGIGVLSGNVAARALGVILAGLSAVVNLAFISAYPVWCTIIIAVDVLVIYALTVHGKELRDTAV